MKKIKRNFLVMLMCALVITCVSVTSMKTEAAHKHSWEYAGRKAATCHETGFTAYKCKCGTKKTVISKKRSHCFLATHIVTPTCTEGGLSESICSYCGDKKTSYSMAYGHKWVGTHRTINGKKVKTWFKCSRCQVRRYMY